MKIEHKRSINLEEPTILHTLDLIDGKTKIGFCEIIEIDLLKVRKSSMHLPDIALCYDRAQCSFTFVLEELFDEEETFLFSSKSPRVLYFINILRIDSEFIGQGMGALFFKLIEKYLKKPSILWCLFASPISIASFTEDSCIDELNNGFERYTDDTIVPKLVKSYSKMGFTSINDNSQIMYKFKSSSKIG